MIEYQKCCVLHLDLLVFLRTDQHFLTAANIDAFICAELPPTDDTIRQELRDIMERTMVHTHCVTQRGQALGIQGLDAMMVQTCKKDYSQAFQDKTIIGESGYPTYHWRNTRLLQTVTFKRNGEHVTSIIHNRRVVLYRPYLSLRYKAHINVKFCGSVKTVKYIYKYI